MAPRKKTLAGTWRGPKAETFTTITWHSANRTRHEAACPDRPWSTAAELADWSRIHKRVDAEHPKPGKNSFQALVGRQLVGASCLPPVFGRVWPCPRILVRAQDAEAATGPMRRTAAGSSKG